MSNSELLALGLAALVVVVVAGTIQLVGAINRRRLDARRPTYDGLSSRLGFDLSHQRWVFETHVTRLRGSRGDLDITLELDHSEDLAYTRIWVNFPVPLDIGFRLVTESEESLWSRIIRMRELEIGSSVFDPHFVLLGRDEERLKRLLDQDVRRMMLDLFHDTEFIAIDDDAMTLLASGEKDEDWVARFVDLSVQLALRLARGADRIHSEDRAGGEEASRTSAFTPVPGDIEAVEGGT